MYHFDGCGVIRGVSRPSAVLNEQKLEAAVIALSHGRMDAHLKCAANTSWHVLAHTHTYISRDATDYNARDVLVAQDQF